MKILKLIAIFCILSADLFAQTPKAIEADFDKAFEKISYWNEHSSEDTHGDGLFTANLQIEAKVKSYTQKCPAALDQAFKKIGLVSDDGLFRILSWDNMTGGTQHAYENIIQYKSAGKTFTIVDTVKNDDDYIYAYNKLHTLKVGSEIYYLTTYYGIFHTYDMGAGIRVFAIQNGKLNDKAKLIKTRSGLTHKLYYTYHVGEELQNGLEYHPEQKIITFPVVIGDGKVTDNIITYKFNGQYFEKIKS
ncbi:hypothetical protein [Mucilaginibacter endophyticus]|uniref:hypothetical protein n=1 Tax=Mucilaginibacter endophyticus TaxID=2675003 RepID=UPI000E0CC7F0|nr:hypothetical protein [Mucilaginibacter endophyticus]